MVFDQTGMSNSTDQKIKIGFAERNPLDNIYFDENILNYEWLNS
jgi:hypothetical protein